MSLIKAISSSRTSLRIQEMRASDIKVEEAVEHEEEHEGVCTVSSSSSSFTSVTLSTSINSIVGDSFFVLFTLFTASAVPVCTYTTDNESRKTAPLHLLFALLLVF